MLTHENSTNDTLNLTCITRPVTDLPLQGSEGDTCMLGLNKCASDNHLDCIAQKTSNLPSDEIFKWNKYSDHANFCRERESTGKDCSPDVRSNIVNSNFKFKLVHQNIQSLGNKVQEFEMFLNEENPDFACLTELCLSEEEFQSVCIENYRPVCCSYRQEFKGGGVGFFVKNHLEISPVEKIKKFNIELHCEISAIEIKHEKTIILGVYRSPNGDVKIFLENLAKVLDSVSSRYKFIILCGDINLDLLACDNANVQRYNDLFSSYGLESKVLEPTRVTFHSQTLLDHLLTNIDKELCSVEVLNSALSDHYAQSMLFKMTKSGEKQRSRPKLKEKRNFSEAGFRIMFRHLSQESWQEMHEAKSAEEKFQEFNSKFSYYFDLAFPKKTVKSTFRPRKINWMTKGILKSRETLKNLNWRASRTSCPDFQEYLRSYRRIYRRVLRAAKALTIQNRLENATCKQKTAWQILNQERGKIKQTGGSIELLEEGKIISDDAEVARTLNEKFVHTVESLVSGATPTADTAQYPVNQRSMFLNPVTTEEMISIVRGLKNKVSAGHDEVPLYVFKRCAQHIVEPLCTLVNSSFEEGTFPNALKIARVVPLFKGGEKNNWSNYRPVSVLSSLSKIFEVALAKRLYSFLEDSGILSSHQHGFQKKRSTVTAVAQFLNEIHAAWEDKKYALGVFMDLSKAFDCVQHHILLSKLEKLGVRGVVIKLLKSYLTERKQFVQVNNKKSSEIDIKHGVPQGSILGPLLFLIYINDLPDQVQHGRMVLFADDSNLITTGKKCEELEIQTFIELANIKQWFEKNGLVLNTNKSNFILFKNKNKPDLEPSIILGDDPLERARFSKFLGIGIDESLTWDYHTDTLCGQLSSSIFLLRQMRSYCEKDLLTLLYHSLFASKARYGIEHWGGGPAYNMERVLVLQKRAVRILAHLRYGESCREAFKTLKLLTIPSMYILDSVTFVVRNNVGRTTNEISCRQTRQANDFFIEPYRLSSSRAKVQQAGTFFFNLLPVELKEQKNSSKFRKLLKDYLVDGCFYSVREFSERHNALVVY